MKEEKKTGFGRAQILLILVAGAIGFGVNYSEPSPERYRAKVTMLVEFAPEGFVGGGPQETDASNDFWTARLNTMVDSLANTRLMRQVIIDHDLVNQAEFVGATTLSELDPEGSLDRYSRMLASMVTVSARAGTHLFDISVFATNAGLARDLVNWIAAGFIKQNGERQLSRQKLSLALLTEEADRLKRKQISSATALAEFRKSTGLALEPREREAFLKSRLTQLQETLVPVMLEIAKAHDDLSLIENLGENPAVEALGTLASIQELEKVKRIQGLIESHLESRSLLPELERRALESDDDVLEHLESRLQDAMRRAPVSIELKLERLKTDERRVRDMMDKTNKELFDLSQLTVEFDFLRGEFEATKEVRESVLGRIREFDLHSGRAQEVLSIVEESHRAADITPDSHGKSVLGAIFGLLVGFCGVWGWERFRLMNEDE